MAAPLRIVKLSKCPHLTNTAKNRVIFQLNQGRDFSISSICNEKKLFKDDADFRTYDLKKNAQQWTKYDYKRNNEDPLPPRNLRMNVDQDWTAVWPTAKTFNWSSVPLPIRQGAAERAEGRPLLDEYGIPPSQYGNTELLKIPNFLHLTPKHIHQQCEAIKKFCTRWPDELTARKIASTFPVEVITSDYCFSGPSIRDPRARITTLKFKISDLELNYHARDKMMRLLGKRYDRKTGMVTLVADRCPLKVQNYEYVQYLMTAVYFESWKVEDWESGKAEADMEAYMWNGRASKPNLVHLLNVYKDKMKDLDEEGRQSLSHLAGEITSDTVASLDEVKPYQSAVEELHNTGENIQTLNDYKQSVMDMLKIQKAALAVS